MTQVPAATDSVIFGKQSSTESARLGKGAATPDQQPVETLAPSSPALPIDSSAGIQFVLARPCPAVGSITMDASPGAVAASNMPSQTLNVNGFAMSVEITEMQYCRHTKVIIRLPAQSAMPAHEVDTDAVGSGIGVDVFAVLWTNSSAAGMSCDDIKGTDCKQLIRQMPLVYSAVDDALVAILVPDSSAAHYSFVVQVSSPCVKSSWFCIHFL